MDSTIHILIGMLSMTLNAFMGYISYTVVYLDHWHTLYYTLFITVEAILAAGIKFAKFSQLSNGLQVILPVFYLVTGWFSAYGSIQATFTCLFSPFDGCRYTGWINWGFISALTYVITFVAVSQMTIRLSPITVMIATCIALAFNVLQWYFAHVLSIQQHFCEADIDSQGIFGDILRDKSATSSNYVLDNAQMLDAVANVMPKVIKTYIDYLVLAATAIGVLLGSFATGDPTLNLL